MLLLSIILFVQPSRTEVYVACFGEDKSDACSRELHCRELLQVRGATEIGMQHRSTAVWRQRLLQATFLAWMPPAGAKGAPGKMISVTNLRYRLKLPHGKEILARHVIGFLQSVIIWPMKDEFVWIFYVSRWLWIAAQACWAAARYIPFQTFLQFLTWPASSHVTRNATPKYFREFI